MLPAGTNTTACGEVKLWPYSLLTADGFTLLPTHLRSTTLSLDSKANSLDKSIPGLMSGRAPITIGYIKVLMKSMFGVSPTKCGAGLNTKMVPTFSQLTKLKLDGTIFPTVELILLFNPDMVRPLLSMCTTTTSTLSIFISNQLRLVVSSQPPLVHS